AEVEAENITPVRIGITGQGQESPTKIELIGPAAVGGVDTVKAGIVTLKPSINFETEVFVSTVNLQPSFGFDDQIGAVGGNGARLDRGRYQQGQGGRKKAV